jgi:hypothetical protein
MAEGKACLLDSDILLRISKSVLNLGAKSLSFTTRVLQQRDRRASRGAPESSMREATSPQAIPQPR